MASYRSIRDFDWALLIVSLGICSLGVLQIFSATRDTIWRDAWWKQVIYILVAVVLMWIISRIDYHTLLAQVPLALCHFGAALVATFIIGKTVFGSRRWIPIAGFHLQVSEFVKLVLVLLVARFLTELKTEQLELPDLLKLGGLIGVPMVLVMKQPDLGTALTYLPVLGVGVVLAGLRWKYVAAIAVVCALVMPVSWFLLKDYQRARLVSFMDPNQDPKGNGYQVIQSRIAVGSGGMWGRGVTHGKQTQYGFLPVPHTDFIFSAFAEEHGFVGRNFLVGAVFLAVDAGGAERANVYRQRGDVHLYGRGGCVAVPRSGQRGNGGGADAGNRDSLAADELRRK